MYPEIAKEFCIFDTCYRRKVRNPYEVIYTSNEEVMWVCKEGHMWREKINLRVKNGKGCRTCEKYQQSIALHNPEIAKEWHPTKNKEVYGVTTPEETSTRCNERAWWVFVVSADMNIKQWSKLDMKGLQNVRHVILQNQG
ncbi:zinc-ribbon domain-containing protein [Bacillus thuringiensis]